MFIDDSSLFTSKLRRNECGTVEQLRPRDDPEGWFEPFAKWLDSSCVVRRRIDTNVRALHGDFCEWAIKADDVPCTREVFVELLATVGFKRYLLDGAEMAVGIGLWPDVEALAEFCKRDEKLDESRFSSDENDEKNEKK
jgi:hypothetical protein